MMGRVDRELAVIPAPKKKCSPALRRARLPPRSCGPFCWARQYNPPHKQLQSSAQEEVPLKKKVSVCGVVMAFSALMCAAAYGQNPQRVVIRAGRVIDVRSGKALANQAIAIEGGKIVSVGPASELKSTPGDKVVDLTQATVLPGLIDAH